jgi:hypothetical protein
MNDQAYAGAVSKLVPWACKTVALRPKMAAQIKQIKRRGAAWQQRSSMENK